MKTEESAFTIRPATAADYDALCLLMDEVDALHRAALPHRFQPSAGPVRERDYLTEQIESPETAIFIAEDDAGPLGFVHVLLRQSPPLPLFVPRRYAVVDDLGVTPRARRRGIGRALMGRAHGWAMAQGVAAVELNVYAFNEAAIAFYQDLGYAVVSVRMEWHPPTETSEEAP